MGKVADKLKRKAQAKDKADEEAGKGYHPELTEEDLNPPEVVDVSGEDGPATAE